MTDFSSQENDQAQPLVSVICRTTNRPLLIEAIASVANQTYRPLEIVLVDALGKGISDEELPGKDIPINTFGSDEQLGRAQAANKGLDNIQGKYCMFLDDDDWIAEDHVENLVAFLNNQKRVRAAYSSTQMAELNGTLADAFFEHPFDPVLLMRDNYIPIHAMVFDSSLISDGCRFDESFNNYEDWDFWIQLSRLTEFQYIEKLTAYYRRGGESDTAITDNQHRYTEDHPAGRARAELYEKWRKIWSGYDLNQLIGSMADIKELNRLAAILMDRDASLKDRDASLKDRDASLKDRDASLKVRDASIKSLHESNYYLEQKQIQTINQVEGLSTKIAQMERDYSVSKWHQDQHIKVLHSRIEEIYSLFSWRVMGPYRRTQRLINKLVLHPIKRRIHYLRHGAELIDSSTVNNSSPNDLEIQPLSDIDRETLKLKYRKTADSDLAVFLKAKRRLSFPLSDEPKVSILLILFNQAPLTLMCLESIAKYAPDPYEIVIVNNASTDETKKLLPYLESIKLIENNENLGFVEAVNQGIAECSGQYTLLLNNDALLHDGSIASALDTIETVPNTGAVGGRILLLDGYLQEAGSFIFNDGSCLGFGRHQSPENPEYLFRRSVDYCSGAFLLFSTALFNEMGGFDIDYAPAYYEDSDFCVRLQKSGLNVVYDPGAIITHYEFASSGGQSKASELQQKHRDIFCLKHQDFLKNKCTPLAENLLSARSANQYKNVLVIDDRVPHTNLGSGYPRCKEMLSILANNNLNLSLYPLQFPHEEWNETYRTVPNNVEVLLDYGLPRLEEFLVSRIGFYDFIVVSRVHNMMAFNQAIKSMPDLLSKTKLIYDAEAVTAPREIIYRELNGEQVTKDEKYRLVEEEVSIASLADSIICVSTNEAELYKSRGYSNTQVLGHSIKTNLTPMRFEQRKDLLFVGALRDENSPNVDSLHWFIKEIFPKLLEKIPDIRLLIVGDNLAPSLSNLIDRNIDFLGRLDDISTFYNTCRLFIAPTRFAAGIPHKVHEAASFGLPCVTTTLLAEQLNWQDGKQLLAADSAELFTEKCLELYLNMDLWKLIRSNATKSVEEDCSSEHFTTHLLKLFA